MSINTNATNIASETLYKIETQARPFRYTDLQKAIRRAKAYKCDKIEAIRVWSYDLGIGTKGSKVEVFTVWERTK